MLNADVGTQLLCCCQNDTRRIPVFNRVELPCCCFCLCCGQNCNNGLDNLRIVDGLLSFCRCESMIFAGFTLDDQMQDVQLVVLVPLNLGPILLPVAPDPFPEVVVAKAPRCSMLSSRSSLAKNDARAWCQRIVLSSGITATVVFEVFRADSRRRSKVSSSAQRVLMSLVLSSLTVGSPL